MLTKEELETLREQLSRELSSIIVDAHASVDAEIIQLCTRLDDVSPSSTATPFLDMTGRKKIVKIELDLRAVEVLAALHRMKANAYGMCTVCGVELRFEELQANPPERFCGECRVNLRRTRTN